MKWEALVGMSCWKGCGNTFLGLEKHCLVHLWGAQSAGDLKSGRDFKKAVAGVCEIEIWDFEIQISNAAWLRQEMTICCWSPEMQNSPGTVASGCWDCLLEAMCVPKKLLRLQTAHVWRWSMSLGLQEESQEQQKQLCFHSLVCTSRSQAMLSERRSWVSQA